jgi:hypothetical protein
MDSDIARSDPRIQHHLNTKTRPDFLKYPKNDFFYRGIIKVWSDGNMSAAPLHCTHDLFCLTLSVHLQRYTSVQPS